MQLAVVVEALERQRHFAVAALEAYPTLVDKHMVLIQSTP
jgi:hypothetical protein